MTAPDRMTLLAQSLVQSRETSGGEWWRGAIIYQIYLRSFMDSDGVGIGDFRGVIEKLDHIESLGVDGLWMSPFYPSPQKDFGYDISDLRSIDPQFGTMDDFHALLDAVHDRNMKLLIDFVPGHTSDEHPWFLESRTSRDNPRADWYVWADAAADGGPPNNWLSSFGGSAWTWDPARSQYYYHPFLTCQPALNLQHPEALAAITEVLRFWLDLGVDGFRLDAVQCLCCDPIFRDNPPDPSGTSNRSLGGGPNNPFRHQLHIFDRDVPEALPVMEALRETVDTYAPERVLIGELADVDASRMGVKYTEAGRRLHVVYDFDLIHSPNSIEDLRNILNIRTDFVGSGSMMNVFTNHDSVRAVSNFNALPEVTRESDKLAKLLLFLQTTLMGGAILFQGEELGLTQPRLDVGDLQDPWGKALWPDFEGRDGVRTPMPWHSQMKNAGFSTSDDPWLPVPEHHIAKAVDLQDENPGSVLNVLRALLHWRRTRPVLRHGAQKIHPRGAAPVLAFDRFDDNDRLTCVVNFGPIRSWFPVDNGARVIEVDGCATCIEKDGLILDELEYGVIEQIDAERS